MYIYRFSIGESGNALFRRSTIPEFLTAGLRDSFLARELISYLNHLISFTGPSRIHRVFAMFDIIRVIIKYFAEGFFYIAGNSLIGFC